MTFHQFYDPRGKRHAKTRYLTVIERILVEPMQVETFSSGGGSAAIPMSRNRQQQPSEDDDMPHLGGTPT